MVSCGYARLATDSGSVQNSAIGTTRTVAKISKTLQYELNQQGMEAFYAHHVAHAPYLVARYRRLRWTSSGIFVLIALAYLPLRSSGTAVFLVLAVVYFVFFYRIHHWSYVRYYRRVNAGPDGPRLGAVKLELRDHDLLVESPEASSRINLSAVRRIDESDSRYYLPGALCRDHRSKGRRPSRELCTGDSRLGCCA